MEVLHKSEILVMLQTSFSYSVPHVIHDVVLSLVAPSMPLVRTPKGVLLPAKAIYSHSEDINACF